MKKSLIVAGLIAGLAVACTTPGDSQNGETEQAAQELSEEAEAVAVEAEQAAPRAEPERAPRAPMWSEEGLEEQDRLEDLKAHDFGDPGTTDWVTSDFPVPDSLGPDGEGANSPGSVLVRLADGMDVSVGLGGEIWEQTMRVHQESDDQAVGLILQWGMKDDSMAGRDFRAHMKRGDAGWYVNSLEHRFHCARGVGDEGFCL